MKRNAVLTHVDHIDLKVPHLESAVAFLTSMGLIVVRRTDPERGSVELALPGPDQVVFELREDSTLTSTTLNHVAFRSDDSATDLDAFEAAGIPVLKRHAFIAHSGRTISNTADPSGVTWQLTD